MVPPDPFPNSAVKRSCADGSVGSPHVRVGHRQAPNNKALVLRTRAFLLPALYDLLESRASLPTGKGYEQCSPIAKLASNPEQSLLTNVDRDFFV